MPGSHHDTKAPPSAGGIAPADEGALLAPHDIDLAAAITAARAVMRAVGPILRDDGLNA